MLKCGQFRINGGYTCEIMSVKRIFFLEGIFYFEIQGIDWLNSAKKKEEGVNSNTLYYCLYHTKLSFLTLWTQKKRKKKEEFFFYCLKGM